MDGWGYLFFSICKDGQRKNMKVHRLVASSFIPNPNNYPVVNHINGIKADNRVENLEWCTYSENTLHAFRTGLLKPQITMKGRFGKLNPNSKSIKCINKITGEVIKIYDSKADASRELKIHPESISQCATGRTKTAGGFKWEYIKTILIHEEIS